MIFFNYKKSKKFFLSENIKGIFYIILAALCFAAMSASIKLLLYSHNVIEIMFLRSIFAFAILVIFFKLKIFSIKKTYFKLHFFRTIIGLSAMFFTFTALKEISLSNVTIINFSKVFFIIPLAVLFFKENVSLLTFINIFIGFFGVAIIIGFDFYNLSTSIYYLYALLGAFLIALVKVLIKKISIYEKSLNIQFWFSFNSCLFLIIPYYQVANHVKLTSLFIIILATILGLLAQFFTIEGLRFSKSIIVMPFDFFRVIFATVIGICFFSENISLLFLVGSLMIFFSGVQLMRTK